MCTFGDGDTVNYKPGYHQHVCFEISFRVLTDTNWEEKRSPVLVRQNSD